MTQMSKDFALNASLTQHLLHKRSPACTSHNCFAWKVRQKQLISPSPNRAVRSHCHSPSSPKCCRGFFRFKVLGAYHLPIQNLRAFESVRFYQLDAKASKTGVSASLRSLAFQTLAIKLRRLNRLKPDTGPSIESDQLCNMDGRVTPSQVPNYGGGRVSVDRFACSSCFWGRPPWFTSA